jgi:hypothetical protein
MIKMLDVLAAVLVEFFIARDRRGAASIAIVVTVP